MSRATTMAYIQDIAIRVNNPGIYGGASLMVGAGFSKNAESIGNRKTPPDWKELSAAMYEELYPRPVETDKIKEWDEQKIVKTSGKNTLHLAEEYIAFFDRNKMDALIENNIADDMFQPGDLHRRLLRLNWKDIFTTNYDTLLERTKDEIFPKRDYRIIVSQDNLPGSGGGMARIIKLHGSIPGVRPYTISEEDFRCYPMKYAAFVNTVQQALIETTLCMVGFSGDDPNFLSWHGWLHDHLGENCPQIYLIGLFGRIYNSEREIFRKRKIALVDLEDLLDEDEEGDYVKAYEKFFDLIESNTKERRFSDEAPYYNRDIFEWNDEEEDSYVTDILEFSNKILNQNRDVVLLPQPQRNDYRNYFTTQFDLLLRNCKHVNQTYLQTLSNLAMIQRMCLRPLYDNQADRLTEICNEFGEQKVYNAAKWKMQIYLYMLEMYRIDSNEEKYQEIVKKCEKILINLPDSDKNMYWIERAKYFAGLFRAGEVKEQLEKIEKADVKINIAKAGLYIQIGENDIAKKILEDCRMNLYRSRLSFSATAAYKSYLCLCYDSLNLWWNREDDYSDYEYRDDPYCTRSVLIELENELRDEILKETAKDDTRINVFDVNVSRGESLIIGDNKFQRLSFEFILMLDMLCLPMFADVNILIPTAMFNIMETSPNAYWKTSFMVRANDKDVAERFFSRKNIAKTDVRVMKELYDNLWNCVTNTKYKNHNSRHAFFSHINALNILSRLVVFLDDRKIIELIKYIASVQFGKEDHSIIDVRNFIFRISTRFNGKIGEELLKEIFVTADSRICLASHFTYFKMKIGDSDRFYMNAIRLAGSSSDDQRDNGIAQLLCLWRNCVSSKFREQIVSVLWNRGKEAFPHTRIFYEMVWEDLPHPAETDFPKLYKEYIYDGLVNHISDRDLFRYINLFYLTSPISDRNYSLIEIDQEFLENILSSIENELINEKSHDIGIDLWGKNAETLKLRFINEFLVMAYAIGIENPDVTNLLPQMERVSELLRKKRANCFALEAVKKAIADEYEKALDAIKPAVWSNDEKAIAEAITGYRAILFVAKKRKGDVVSIKNAIIEIMETLQYSDIKFVKSMWNALCQMIVDVFSEDIAAQDRLAKVFENCLRSYSYKGIQGDKYNFEALYNCNKTLKSYYDEIVSKKIELHDSLKNVIDFVKTLAIPELLTTWT